MKRGSTPAETCALNGWVVGDVLEDENKKTRIRISAIGKTSVLAVWPAGEECLAGFGLDWRKVEPQVPAWILRECVEAMEAEVLRPAPSGALRKALATARSFLESVSS